MEEEHGEVVELRDGVDGGREPRGTGKEVESGGDVENVIHGFKEPFELEPSHGIGFFIFQVLQGQGSHGIEG